MHYSLVVLGKLRSVGVLPRLNTLYKPLDFLASKLAPFGEDQGCMVVSTVGRTVGDGNEECLLAKKRSWSLVAERGQGPFVAAAPACAVVNNLALIAPGARACLCELPVEEVLHALRDIHIEVQTSEEDYPALFQKALQRDWNLLAPAIKATHLVDDELFLQGQSSVERGKSLIARLVAFIFRFPVEAKQVDVSVLKRRIENGEVWIRNFAGQNFQSTLTTQSTSGDRHGRVFEKFGLVTFELALEIKDAGMHMPVSRGWFLGIPLPKVLLPISKTREYESNHAMHFDVQLDLPFSLGLLVHYRGRLHVHDSDL